MVARKIHRVANQMKRRQVKNLITVLTNKETKYSNNCVGE